MYELHKYNSNKKYLNILIHNKRYAWKHLFETAIHSDFQMTLSKKSLMDPKSEIVCILMYILSMESFVYTTLNAAT